MPARASMTAIIAELRLYGAAATDDVFGGVTYWTDEQLQKIADRNSRQGFIELEQADPAGLVYRLKHGPSLQLENALTVYASDQTTALANAFTYNSDTKELTFTEAPASATYYVYGRAIQIYDALAELWQAKADQRYQYIDWKAQNNRSIMRQEYQNCVDRATLYRSKRVRSFSRTGVGDW
jgi:hypothetical protein